MLPVIGALLANGMSLLANAAMVKGKDYIKEKTGVDLDQPTLSHDELLKLKQYEAEHEEELLKIKLEERKIDIDEVKAYLADTQGARGREEVLANSTSAPWVAKAATPILGIGTVILTFVVFAYAMSADFTNKEATKEITIYILGVLSAIVTQIFGYYFGSSTGSKAKSDIIGNQLRGKS